MNAFVTPDQNSMTELPKIIDPRTKRREPFFSAQDSSSPAVPPQAELVDQNGHRFSITRIPYLMGRSGDCDLVLSGRGVSRSHAEIEWLDGQYHIRDLRSLNGTRVNGLTITRVILKNGDRVELGQTTLVFNVVQSEIFPIYATQQRITDVVEPRQRSKKKSESPNVVAPTATNSKLTFFMWFNFTLLAVAMVAGGAYFLMQGSSDIDDEASQWEELANDKWLQASKNSKDFNMAVAPNTASDPTNPPVNNTTVNSPDSQIDSSEITTNQLPVIEPVEPEVATEKAFEALANQQKIARSVEENLVEYNQPIETNASIPDSNKNYKAPQVDEADVNNQSTRISSNVGDGVVPKTPIVDYSSQALKAQRNMHSAFTQGIGISAALSEVEKYSTNSSVSQSTRTALVKDFKEYKALYEMYQKGVAAYDQKDYESAYALWNETVAEEEKITGKQGGLSQAIQSKVAASLIEQGNAELSAGRQASAYQLWQDALKIDAKNPKLQAQIHKVDQEVKSLYEQAISLEATQPAQMVQILTTIINRVPPGHDYHTRASAKLSWINQGAAASS